MRNPMRWMTISAVLSGGVFLVVPPLRPAPAADDVAEVVIEPGASGGEPADVPRGAETRPAVPSPIPRPRPGATTLRAPRDGHLTSGAAGTVHWGRRRIPYETVIEETGRDPRLVEYRERRQEAEPTASSQWALAEWCRRQRLTDQERAHLTAVIALDPTHRAAHERLGHVQVADGWVDAVAIADERAAARRSAASRRKHAAALDSLARQIGEGVIDPDAAVVRVQDLGTRAGIEALESHLSLANEPAAATVVQVLSDDSSDGAAASLVRHALSSVWPEVRQAAAGALAARDRGTFVPLLIDAFDAPWTTRIQWQRGPDGTIACRQIGFREGAEERHLSVHDHLVVPIGVFDRAIIEGTRQAAGMALDHEDRKDAANEQIAMANQSIATLLRATTGETMSDDPAEWREWWSRETGTSRRGEKPTRVTWRSSRSTARGVTPPKEVRRLDCLAGGTPVWTAAGPVAVDRLQPGDLVLTQNPITGVLGLEPILAATIRPPEKVLAIGVAGKTIRSTAGHPFWVVGKGWTLARHLEPGHRLHGLDGGAVVKSIDEESEPVRTFNLVVDGDHTYFCGEARVMSRDNSDSKPGRPIASGGR